MEKIKKAIEEARRQRDRSVNPAPSPGERVTEVEPALEEKIRRLTPIADLPYSYQSSLVRQGDILSFSPGSNVFSQGTADQYVHYLLEGSVTFMVAGRASRRLWASSDVSRFAMDEANRERPCTALVDQAAYVFRIDQSLIDRELGLAGTAPPPQPDEVVDITEVDATDWIVVTLRDGLFAHLPMETIQHVLSEVEEVRVADRDIVLEQNTRADYFYLIKEGTADVTRRPTPDSPPVRLAVLKPGDGFGEEALIADSTRNATVTMTSDGVLMKLTRGTFNHLIRDPLLKAVPLDEAERLVDGDSVWIDVRDPDRFRISTMPGAINLPLETLRLRYRDLDAEKSYIVFSENAAASAVAAFLLSSRGFDARYVNDALYPPLPEPVIMTEPSAPKSHEASDPGSVTIRHMHREEPESSASDVDRMELAPAEPSFYADTQSGAGLAALVEEIRADNEQIASSDAIDPTEMTITGATNIELDDAMFDFELDRLQQEPGAVVRPPDPGPDSNIDPIAKIFQELQASFYERIEAVRLQERARVEEHIKTRVERVQKRAQQLIRDKILEARARDKERTRVLEQRLRDRYEKLERVTNKITHQKAELQRARRQLEEKFRAADGLQRELATLGQTITQQMENLDDLMPDEGMEESG